MKSALITGITGQDGAYLAKFLLSKGYRVYGTFRRLSTPNFWRLQALGVFPKVKLISMDLGDFSSISEALTASKPDEIYHLAAQSFVGASFEQPISTSDMSGLATTRILEATRIHSRDARFYQASTSELFGGSQLGPRSESSPFEPQSPYAAAKLYAYWMTKIYRESYGMFTTNGILFNHESPLRGLEFVTRKISNACARIGLGLQDKIRLGNLEARRDWGYAPDYVESMWMMMQQDKADDYVVATGVSHSVADFVQLACERLNIDMSTHIRIDKSLLRPLEVDRLVGDAKKAKTLLHWEPRLGFSDLVTLMVEADLKRWKDWQAGKFFPWDAPLYPDANNIIVTRYSLDR
ncbi:MAG: GDP-mannose 4,6-dehydratase [Nitrososphaerota archaeon]|nr:GDP-mannose 4,6-dehydratase [Nitrososphaerota archaeon]